MLHTIAFYNVENFYDTIDDKKVLDGDYTYYGKKSWDKNRYHNKLIRIANAIIKIGEKESQKNPTFFGLCEIENKKVIEDLLKEFPFGANYGYVHTDSQDERGIDTAFFYNKEFFKLEKTEFIRIPVFNSEGIQDFTRDITYVKGQIKGLSLHFYVLHLPSKRERDINQSKRIHILIKLREHIDSIFEEDKDANIVIMGDFNENPTVPYIYNELKCKKRMEELSEGDLFNPSEDLYREGKFSIVHKREGLLFDQILFSESFFKKEKLLQFIKSEVFNAPFLQDKERGKTGTPLRTYSGSRYLGGYSDHFPVYSLIEID